MKSPISFIVSSLKDELTCALCQDVFDRPQALIPCLHTFCSDCADSIPRDYGDAFSCPICRSTAELHEINTQNLSSGSISEEDQSSGSGSRSSASTPTRIIESLNIDSNGPGESSPSSTVLNITFPSINSGRSSHNTKRPCRSCRRGNGTNYTCDIPITETQQSGFGHLFCGFCSEYLPARGFGGNEPALNQCCSFCGIVACDEYWGCKNRDQIAKLYILSEIRSIKQYLMDVDQIDTLTDGHLNLSEIKSLEDYLNKGRLTWTEAWSACLQDFNDNHYTTAIARRMTPLAHQLYNTRRLVNHHNNSNGGNNRNSVISEEEEEEEDDGYYDRIGEEGILPSNHLRACYSCAVTMVNGQFYGYWRDILTNGSATDYRRKCEFGNTCEAQWSQESHATRFSHIERAGEPRLSSSEIDNLLFF